jgi:hypothetical protein
LDEYWAKNHVYVRLPELFEWTFSRRDLWDREGYSFALAENQSDIVGILGGIPFVFNCLGHESRAIWLVNYMVRPDHRRGPAALRLLGMFRRPPYETVIAFGNNPSVVPFYGALRARTLLEMPRHFIVLPAAVERAVELLRMIHPDWSSDRAEQLVHAFKLPHYADVSVDYSSSLSPNWDRDDWPRIARRTVGAVRNMDYLTWRYAQHPYFNYRFITAPEGDRTGLAVWRLETIYHDTPEGRKELDRIGRLVEFLPASRNNATQLLAVFWQELHRVNALAADYYGYHGETRKWLNESGFHGVEGYPDCAAIPSRFQPVDGRGGNIRSAIFVRDEAPSCSMDPDCIWYWTKAESDQDRPN